jgi:hypothetical protein
VQAREYFQALIIHLSGAQMVAQTFIMVGLFVSHCQVDPPRESRESQKFKSWAKFDVGTFVTVRETVEIGETKAVVTVTIKLVERKDDLVILESVSVSNINGKETKAQPKKLEVKKYVESKSGVELPDLDSQEGVVEQGEETIKTAAGEFKTKWKKRKLKSQGSEVDATQWICDDVPQRLVKMTSTIKGKVSSKLTSEVIEFKKP